MPIDIADFRKSAWCRFISLVLVAILYPIQNVSVCSKSFPMVLGIPKIFCNSLRAIYPIQNVSICIKITGFISHGPRNSKNIL
jgi:hypothetical protein